MFPESQLFRAVSLQYPKTLLGEEKQSRSLANLPQSPRALGQTISATGSRAAEVRRSGYTGRQVAEKEGIWMEVFQLLQSCPASPQCIQLWRSKVITTIHENVCTVNSLGDSHAEALETLVLQGGDA